MEISKLAIQNADNKFRNEPRAAFTHYDGDILPFENTTFSRVACVNVIYFWSDVLAMFSEVHRVLTNGGKLILGYSDQSPDEVTSFLRKDIEEQLRSVGFEAVHTTEVFDKDNDIKFCTVALKAVNLAE